MPNIATFLRMAIENLVITSACYSNNLECSKNFKICLKGIVHPGFEVKSMEQMREEGSALRLCL
jgi:hypothetical protein